MQLQSFDKEIYKIVMNSNVTNIRSILGNTTFHSDEEKINAILKIYVDPDKVIGNFIVPFNGSDYRVSLDGFCSIRHLLSIYKPDEIPSKLYDIRRACFIWPCHSIPTINTYRASIVYDRVDYTLFAIKEYLSQNNIADKQYIFQKVINHHSTNTSAQWLDSFGSFTSFINQMQLQFLVEQDKISKNYIVMDYMTNLPINSMDTISSINKAYIENLITRIVKNTTNNIY